MPLEIYTTNAEFEALREDWNQLTNDPLRGFEWHYAWWRNFSKNQKLRIYGYWLHGELVSLFPLLTDRWLGQSRVRLIGSGHACTDYAQLIGDIRHHPEFAALIISDLTERLGLDIIEFDGVKKESVDPLRQPFRQLKYWSYERLLESTNN